jgi:hypothetical protein
MERTPSPVHIPVVPTGDDNARLAVDEAGVVIGDRIGPLIAEDAPLRVPRPCRCIRRIATAQGGVGPGYTDPRPVIDAAVAMRDARCRGCSSASASRTLPPVPGARNRPACHRYVLPPVTISAVGRPIVGAGLAARWESAASMVCQAVCLIWSLLLVPTTAPQVVQTESPSRCR